MTSLLPHLENNPERQAAADTLLTRRDHVDYECYRQLKFLLEQFELANMVIPIASRSGYEREEVKDILAKAKRLVSEREAVNAVFLQVVAGQPYDMQVLEQFNEDEDKG